MKKPRLNWAAEPWSDDEMLECTMVVPETPDTASFTFRAPSGAWFDYQPGQFITLDLPVDPARGPAGNVQPRGPCRSRSRSRLSRCRWGRGGC
jgi:hypothetical protein